MRAELRPLSFGELLDRTFTYYREHFWLFVGIMAVPQLATLVVGLPLRMTLDINQPQLRLTASLAATGVTVGIAVFGYAAAYGATTYAVSEIHLGRAVAIGGAYRMMRGQIMPLVYLGLVYLLRALLFFISIVLIPVIFLMPLWYAFAIPVLLLEKIGGNAALKRSGLLTKGERGRIFAIGLLTTIVSSALTLAIQAPFMLAGRGISGIGMSSHNDLLPSGLRLLSDIAEGMAEAFTAPLMMIALVLLYYDVRVRREGFDLQVMMTALDRKDPISAPVVRTVTT